MSNKFHADNPGEIIIPINLFRDGKWVDQVHVLFTYEIADYPQDYTWVFTSVLNSPSGTNSILTEQERNAMIDTAKTILRRWVVVSP